MNRLLFFILVCAGFILMQGCITQKHATVIERDPDNPCIIRMVIQIGVNGGDSDVVAVRDQLEECYNKTCFIPCEADSMKGCKTMMNVIVKKWSDLSDDDKYNFHLVEMVPNDGLPSRAMIGKANTMGVSGTWRRNEPMGVYCHEVLHFLGLDDKYCDRWYNAVTGKDSTGINCNPPPDPNNGTCCVPSATKTRCGTPCHGHEGDMMADYSQGLSCENIRDVLDAAGFNKCPPECCNSSGTYSANDAIFVAPTYYHFSDKSNSFGSFGITITYQKMVTPSLGVTIDAGVYQKIQTENETKETKTTTNITGGATYIPKIFKPGSKFRLSTHLMGGISIWRNKFQFGDIIDKFTEKSFILNIGSAIDMRVNPKLALRLLQIDYMPTFFGEETQHNYRISAGLRVDLGKK